MRLRPKRIAPVAQNVHVERAARLRREAHRATAVAIAHEHGLDRMPVRRVEQRLDGAVTRFALGHELERRERDRLGERCSERLRQRRHVVVRRRRLSQSIPTPVARDTRARRARSGSLRAARDPCARTVASPPVIDLRSDTATKPDRGHAPRDRGGGRRRRAEARRSDGQRAAGARGGAARPRVGDLRADGHDGEPDRAQAPLRGPATSSSRRRTRTS